MTKIIKLFSFMACLVFTMTIFTSIAYADLPVPPDCLPGQDPKTSFCVTTDSDKNTNSQDSQAKIITYAVIGGAILIVTAISTVVLIKTRRKNVN